MAIIIPEDVPEVDVNICKIPGSVCRKTCAQVVECLWPLNSEHWVMHKRFAETSFRVTIQTIQGGNRDTKNASCPRQRIAPANKKGRATFLATEHTTDGFGHLKGTLFRRSTLIVYSPANFELGSVWRI